MANSKFAYVRSFELEDVLLPRTFLLIRIDGKGFHKFSDQHAFAKPNDKRALLLMNHAATSLMCSSFGQDMFLAFGESDEYSFCFKKESTIYGRRASKILTTCVSMFTSFYIRLWPLYFESDVLSPNEEAPSFDGRIIQYPSRLEVIDYFKWRQVDTHINNLYNTCFWALVHQGGASTKEAHERLRGTISSQKHELLFTKFAINYNSIEEIYKKGSILLRVGKDDQVPNGILLLHEDILTDSWWEDKAF